jgi:glycosyltransferase involved in cell wall biosynthesis
MPVYNGQRYVGEAIASVVGQGFADFEFVIIDDGSTDRTPAILAEWAAHDSRIHVHRSPRNEGIPAALNRGLAIARGQYVARQDADDLCVAGRLARQVAVLDADAEVVLVSAGYEIIDAEGRRRGLRMRRDAPEVIEYLLHFSNAVGGHGQVMFRRETVLSLGSYGLEYDFSQDYDLWSRLMRRGRIVVLPMIGMRHRLHEDRVSVVSGPRQQSNSMRISRRNLTTLLHRELRDDEFAALAAVWRQTGTCDSAIDANRLFREAYARFLEKRPSHRHRRAVRMAKAHVWFLSAAMLAKHARFIEALAHAGYSLRWHPLGFMSGVFASMDRAMGYVLRRVGTFRTAESYASAPPPAHRDNAPA